MMTLSTISRTLMRSGCMAAALLLFAGMTPAQQTPAAADTVAVIGVGSAFAGAWNAHNMDALAQLFAVDADFVNVVGIWWHGRDEIRQAHEQTHQTIFKASTLVIDSATARFLSPDIAVVHTIWTLTGHMTPEGLPGPPRHGILSFLVKRQGKGWLIQSAQNTDSVPGVATIPQEK